MADYQFQALDNSAERTHLILTENLEDTGLWMAHLEFRHDGEKVALNDCTVDTRQHVINNTATFPSRPRRVTRRSPYRDQEPCDPNCQD